MSSQTPGRITELLRQWSDGRPEALTSLMPLVYRGLRRLAHQYLRGERADHVLQSTALVHEAYGKLVDHKQMNWRNRAHFFAVSAQLMRRILVDHARRRHAAKRGANPSRLSLSKAADVPEPQDVDLIALDDALNTLQKRDPRQSRIVELKFFAGLSIEEIAEVVGVSDRTVKRDWAMARAWLYEEMRS